MNGIKAISITIFSLFTICLISISFVFAQNTTDFDKHNYENGSYVFYLYFDDGKIVPNRDFEFVYDVVPIKLNNVSGQYKVEILDLLDRVATTTFFDPRSGNTNFIEGAIEVKAPYRADGREAKFYDGAGVLLLTVPVNESSFCDDDGVCEEAYGEDFENCGNDCKNTKLNEAPGTGGLENTAGSGQSGISSLIWIILGGAAFLILLFYGIRWLKSRKNQSPSVDSTVGQ